MVKSLIQDGYEHTNSWADESREALFTPGLRVRTFDAYGAFGVINR